MKTSLSSKERKVSESKGAGGDSVNIDSLVFDQPNANKGNARGRKMLGKSLQQYGAGRSILLDRKGRVIAGNKTLETAIAAGHKDVVVVKTDGSKLVAVQRTDLDLDDKKAKALAVADNRVSEVGLEWDAAVLAEMSKGIDDLAQMFTEDELAALVADVPRLSEREAELRAKNFVRVLLSVPVDKAAEAKEHIDRLSEIPDIQIDYSAN
jgi:hypothetical protein